MKSFYVTAVLALAMAIFTPSLAFANEAHGAGGIRIADAHHASCATECNKCAEECEKALTKLEAKGASAATLNAVKDCITLCKTSADLKSRGSSLSPKLAAACAEACKKCATVCEEAKDEGLKACIAQCNTCAEACTSTAKAGGGKDCCK